MDDDLRNSLWNILKLDYLDLILERHANSSQDVKYLLHSLWIHYFKRPLDSLPMELSKAYGEIREYFFICKWYKVYDFVEFVTCLFPSRPEKSREFRDTCNGALKRELSAYRFVGEKIIRITSEVEIIEIEEALATTETWLKPINIHLKRAFDLLADKKSPDYRNSIKESISGVETICKLIVDRPKATLGDALQQIGGKKSKVKLHSDLIEAFRKLYGFTSDAHGIRHALMDEPNLDFEDAKFMLVTCSAFINYLIVKSSKVGIELH